MQCQYCNNELPPGVPKCPSCGAPAPTVQQAPQQFPQQGMPMQQQYPPQQQYVPQGGGTPYYTPQTNIPPYATPPKNRISYILLAVFLGGLGVHNFYAGYSGRGIAQLLITVLTLGICSIISCVWAIIEACVVTTSADGRPMVS